MFVVHELNTKVEDENKHFFNLIHWSKDIGTQKLQKMEFSNKNYIQQLKWDHIWPQSYT